jgi:hypothetical protein
VQDKKQTWTRHAVESYFYFKNDYDDSDDDSAQAYVSEFIVHPDWNTEEIPYRADIAIAVLKESLEFSIEIGYVCLNTPSDPIQNLAGRNGKVYGWGLTEDLKFVSQLRHADVPLVDQALCYDSSNPKLAKIMSDTSFCAGARDGKTGACNGKYRDFQRFGIFLLL